jgi:hypothetical protein
LERLADVDLDDPPRPGHRQRRHHSEQARGHRYSYPPASSLSGRNRAA